MYAKDLSLAVPAGQHGVCEVPCICFYEPVVGQVWHLPVIPALSLWRQEGKEFKASLSYVANSKAAFGYPRSCLISPTALPNKPGGWGGENQLLIFRNFVMGLPLC